MSTFNITPNVLKYVSGSTNLPNTISPYPYQYAYGINDVGYGTTLETGFYNGFTPPSGGYVLYSGANYQINVANNDTELIKLSNVLMNSNYTNVADCIYNLLDNNIVVFNYNLPDFPTNGLVVMLQSGFSSSFDKSFSGTYGQWFNMSQVGSNSYFQFQGGPPVMSGNYIEFNGSVVNALSGTTNFPIGSSSYTISAWVLTNDNTISQQYIVSWGAESPNQMNSLLLNAGDPTNSYYSNDISAGITIANDAWYNITATYDEGTNTRSIYINGSLYNESLVDGPLAVPTGTSCYIGCSPNADNFFNGLMGNVSIYNTALSADDVYFNYAAWLAFYPPPPTPNGQDFTIEWWQFMDSVGTFPRPFSIGAYPNAANAVSIEGAGGLFIYWANEALRIELGVSGLISNWVNFAIVRNAGILSIYKNGSALGSGVYHGAIPTNGYPFHIGSEGDSGSYFEGLIADFRWTDSAVYTDNYTPSTTPLTALANTKLLCFQGTDQTAQLTDNSGTGNTITNNGTTFDANSPYSGYVGSTRFNGSNADVSVTPVSNFNIANS
jgi:hypothetical protein